MSLLDQETDSLASLEERILEAVQMVGRLRQEKEAAVKEAVQAKAQAAAAGAEIETLRAERAQVRGRIEKLLAQIDQLTTG